MRYEIPELSERWGVYVTATTLARAKRIARQHGCDAVWEVEGEVVPQLVGRIWGYVGGRWVAIEDTGQCTCGCCGAV